MKKTLKMMAMMFVAVSLAIPVSEAKDNNNAFVEEDFQGYWFIGIQGGVGQTVGETGFGSLISPAAAVGFGYQFTPVWGLRAGIGGWQAKGAAIGNITEVYRFNYLQGNVDVMVDICNIFGEYRMNRAVNPYVFAGVGINGAFNNTEAQNLGPRMPADNLLWDGSRVFPAGRFGVGMGIRISDAVHFNLEVNGNFLSDSFNSKKGSAVDWQLGAVAGFTFRIGLKKSERNTEPVFVPEELAEETKPVQPEPVHQPAPVSVQEAEPAAAVAVAEFNPVTENVFFLIGKSEVRDSEMPKLEEVVSLLENNPQTKVTVTGHADAETGSDERNMELSEQRAENVAAVLVKAGISPDRIVVQYKGSSENPYDLPEKNRVAICVVAD